MDTTLSDFKPVKPSTDCARVLTMASKLSKLQCFSTCLSVASWVARREAVSLVKRLFFLPPFSRSARLLSSSLAFQTPNFVPLSPIVPLPHYPAKITLSFCCAIKLQPGEDWQCFSAEGGGQINVFVVAVCAYVCVRVCAWASSECQNVVMCDRWAIVCARVRVCHVTQLSLKIMGLLVMPGYRGKDLCFTGHF